MTLADEESLRSLSEQQANVFFLDSKLDNLSNYLKDLNTGIPLWLVVSTHPILFIDRNPFNTIIMSILFQSVKVIDSQSNYNNKTVDVLVNKGVIESIGKNIETTKRCKIIHGKGLHLSPGLMDLHVNYRDPGYDWKEDLNTGIQASAKGGFTSVLYMPSNNPSTNSKVQVDYIRNDYKGSVVEVYPQEILQ